MAKVVDADGGLPSFPNAVDPTYVKNFLKPLGRDALERIIVGISQFADVKPYVEGGKAKVYDVQARQKGQRDDLAAFSVAVGRQAAGSSRHEFRANKAGGKIRASCTLMNLGNDILSTIHRFFSWGMESQLSWEGHSLKISGCHFSPDGKWILTCSDDTLLCLWDASNGELCQSFEGHRDLVSSCCFHPNGKTILSSSFDSSINFWNIDYGFVENTLVCDGYVYMCCFSDCGEKILSAGEDPEGTGGFKLWSASGAEIKNLGDPDLTEDSVPISCCFSPDGQRFLGGFSSGLLQMRGIAGNDLQKTFAHDDGVVACHFSRDGEVIVSCCEDSAAKVWSVATGALLRTLRGQDRVLDCCISPSGNEILTAGEGSMIRWEMETGNIIRVYDIEQSSSAVSFKSCNFSADGESILGGYNRGEILVWRTKATC